jgi:hypothetical protein
MSHGWQNLFKTYTKTHFTEFTQGARSKAAARGEPFDFAQDKLRRVACPPKPRRRLEIHAAVFCDY